MYKKIMLVFLSLVAIVQLRAQTDTTAVEIDSIQTSSRFQRIFSKTFDRYFNEVSPEKPKFLLYPVLGFSPETNWEFGFSALLLYYARRDTSNRLSELQSFNFITLNKQYGSWIEHFIYTNKDQWFFLGKLRFQRFPLQYYGIGPEARKEDEQLINSNYILIRERVLHKIVPNLFGGLEFDFQKLYNVSIEKNASSLPAPAGSEGSTNFGVGAGLVYDNRHNALNVRKGYFAEAAYLNYSPELGSDYKFRSLTIDSRIYRTVKKNQVFAAQLFGQFISGNPPFNQMALLGSENLMRGYYMGRFRDKNYIAGQAEYRFLPFGFSKRFGATVFVAAGEVAPSLSAFSMKNILPTGGVGIRFLAFPKKDIFIRFDVGFTKEGPAFYIFSGEAF